MWKLLTSRLAGPVGAGLSLLLAIALLSLLLTKNRAIANLERSLLKEEQSNLVLRRDNATLRGNAVTLEAALHQCNVGVAALKTATDAITNAGVKALQEVQKAGTSVDRKIQAIDAMPKETCEDAFKILKQQ